MEQQWEFRYALPRPPEGGLVEHPELEFEFAVDVECCRQAVGVAAGAAERLKPVVHRGFRARLILLRMKLRAFAQRLRKLAG